MVSGIGNIGQSVLLPQLSQRQSPEGGVPLSSRFFDIEDDAIISSEAKMLNELEKFNAGTGDALNLAVACVEAKIAVGAQVNVINAKVDMLDEILEMGR